MAADLKRRLHRPVGNSRALALSQGEIDGEPDGFADRHGLDHRRFLDVLAAGPMASGIATPLLDACHALYGETAALGYGKQDMAAVLHAIEARTDTSRTPG